MRTKASAPAEASAVDARGEIAIELDGVEYVLRPSFEAVGAIESACGKTLLELAQAAESGTLSAAHLAEVVAQCIKAQGRAVGDDNLRAVTAKRIGALLYEADGGLMWAITQVVMRLLFRAVTGGYTALGEAKGAGTRSTTSAPGFVN
ncbi:MAG: GTA-gp10 family protein [Sphingomonadaceae bacterium]|nr:GTA-gp10 family protein [Sphingomonadaceae bacterium]